MLSVLLRSATCHFYLYMKARLSTRVWQRGGGKGTKNGNSMLDDKQNIRDTPARWDYEKVGKAIANNSGTWQYYDC